ncbi:hypothetical protein KC365_g102 [Hortaea werneckii]|nr:hypothetical protein KC365_g102 [Hortaea werneckii]
MNRRGGKGLDFFESQGRSIPLAHAGELGEIRWAASAVFIRSRNWALLLCASSAYDCSSRSTTAFRLRGSPGKRGGPHTVMNSDWLEGQRSRRRLSKAPPTTTTTSGGGSTTAQTQNAHPLRRAPSAPVGKKYSQQAPASAAHHTRSPTVDSHWTRNSNSHAANARLQPYEQHGSRLSQASADIIGERFDSAAVLESFNQVPYSARDAPPSPPADSQTTHHQQPHAGAAHPPRPPNFPHANTTGHASGPGLAQSFQAATGRKMEEVRGPRQRYSDEVKDTRGLKKKSGFSSFFNLSSPRRPNISAPENPVHVTHVGYDQETGEFTQASWLQMSLYGRRFSLSAWRLGSM